MRRVLMTFVMTTLALSAIAIAPASAQSSGSWTLDCKGSGSGGVSWTWLLDGTPISGAGGSATCDGAMSVTGSSARPASANGFAAIVSVSAGYNGDAKSVNKTFDTTASFKVSLSASASGWYQNCDLRCFWAHAHEGAKFSLQG